MSYPSTPSSRRKPGQDVGRVLRAGVGAAQVGVELPVGKVAADPVRDVDRQRRLARAALAGHAHDRQGGLRASRRRGDQPADLPDLLRPAGEVADVRRKVQQRAPPAVGSASCSAGSGRSRGAAGLPAVPAAAAVASAGE